MSPPRLFEPRTVGYSTRHPRPSPVTPGTIRHFGHTKAGHEVSAVDLHAGCLRATILTYGATIQDLRLAGIQWPLVLGARDVSAYEGPLRYCGAIVGPVANRIAGATADIDGRTYHFDANETGITTLHSGSTGTHAQIWQIAEVSACSLKLFLDLPDGLGGFPGQRRITATFTLSVAATLTLDIAATSDRPTLFNLANHSYWNLDGSETTRGHILRIHADHFTPVKSDQTPTGEVLPVAGTPFDLRKGKKFEDIKCLDHNFCTAGSPRQLARIAELRGFSGVSMTLSSTEPGLQVYDGRHFSTGTVCGLAGAPYVAFAGVALEPQRWPDATAHPNFPSIVHDPDHPYDQQTLFHFGLPDNT